MDETLKSQIREILSDCQGDGSLSAVEVADVLSNVAEHGAARRLAAEIPTPTSPLPQIDDVELADLRLLLDRYPTNREKLLVAQCLRAHLVADRGTNRLGEPKCDDEVAVDDMLARIDREMRTGVRDPLVSDADWMSLCLYPLARRGP